MNSKPFSVSFILLLMITTLLVSPLTCARKLSGSHHMISYKPSKKAPICYNRRFGSCIGATPKPPRCSFGSRACRTPPAEPSN
nr:hypothetical protein Iba_chr08fCG3660 [Ipomoea batatas]